MKPKRAAASIHSCNYSFLLFNAPISVRLMHIASYLVEVKIHFSSHLLNGITMNEAHESFLRHTKEDDGFAVTSCFVVVMKTMKLPTHGALLPPAIYAI